ncbi:MAG: 2-succinyl-6-hydroxy-2,4-cyclohexadiene-1-carboxylate synthase [Candidatus Zixiibacteriota bacterium]
MPFFESFYYQAHGDLKNPAIVFLHGFMGNGKSWKIIVDSLVNKFHCITIDLPGHGRTKADDALYSTPKCAEQIVALANQLRLKRFNLVGYSMGGRLALYLALNNADKIKNLVMESSSPGLKTEKERLDRRNSDEALAAGLETNSLREFVEKWYNRPLFQSLRADKKNFESMVKERLDNDALGLAKSLRFMGTGVQESLWGKLRNLNKPTLLIVGELDRKFQGIAKAMLLMSKKIKIECVMDAGHNVHFEKPPEYAELLSGFFSVERNK